jgi:hypothetical protein
VYMHLRRVMILRDCDCPAAAAAPAAAIIILYFKVTLTRGGRYHRLKDITRVTSYVPASISRDRVQPQREDWNYSIMCSSSANDAKVPQ